MAREFPDYHEKPDYLTLGEIVRESKTIDQLINDIRVSGVQLKDPTRQILEGVRQLYLPANPKLTEQVPLEIRGDKYYLEYKIIPEKRGGTADIIGVLKVVSSERFRFSGIYDDSLDMVLYADEIAIGGWYLTKRPWHRYPRINLTNIIRWGGDDYDVSFQRTGLGLAYALVSHLTAYDMLNRYNKLVSAPRVVLEISDVTGRKNDHDRPRWSTSIALAQGFRYEGMSLIRALYKVPMYTKTINVPY